MFSGHRRGWTTRLRETSEAKNEDDDDERAREDYYDVVYAMCVETERLERRRSSSLKEDDDDEKDDEKRLRVREVDVREELDVEKALETIMARGNDDDDDDEKDVDVVCCLGTTAFPSARWKENNGPEQTDDIATANVIRAAKKICFRNAKKNKGEKKRICDDILKLRHENG